MTTTAAPASPHTELDFGSLFKRTWELFAAKPVEHIVAAAIVCLLGGVTLGILLGPLLGAYIRMVDRQREGKPIALDQVFELGGSAVSAIGAWFLMAIGVFIGFLFLVLPGLALLVGWGYCFWFIALERESGVQSLGSSWRLMRRNVGSVVVVWVVLILLASAGGAALLGSLITMPLGTIFATLAFRELRR